MNACEIKVGDLVCLKSGSSAKTVLEILPSSESGKVMVRCAWRVLSGHTMQHTFPAACLEPLMPIPSVIWTQEAEAFRPKGGVRAKLREIARLSEPWDTDRSEAVFAFIEREVADIEQRLTALGLNQLTQQTRANLLERAIRQNPWLYYEFLDAYEQSFARLSKQDRHLYLNLN